MPFRKSYASAFASFTQLPTSDPCIAADTEAQETECLLSAVMHASLQPSDDEFETNSGTPTMSCVPAVISTPSSFGTNTSCSPEDLLTAFASMLLAPTDASSMPHAANCGGEHACALPMTSGFPLTGYLNPSGSELDLPWGEQFMQPPCTPVKNLSARITPQSPQQPSWHSFDSPCSPASPRPLPPVGALLPALASPHGGSIQLTKDNNPLYKTELCRSWLASGHCRYGEKCQFAHGPEELRPAPQHPKFKTKVCQAFLSTGCCPYGSRCRYMHAASPAKASEHASRF